jgi:hypothetical protein
MLGEQGMEKGSESPINKGDPSATESANEPATESASEPAAESEGQPIDPWRMAELCCWFVVVLSPILTWVNGPPVSTDQAVVRWIVFLLALSGGIVFSATNLVRWRRAKQA